MKNFHNFLASSDIIRLIKSRRILWVGHVARMGDVRSICNVLVG